MMRKLALMTMFSAASFCYNAKALGFYTETELAPAVSFVSVTGSPLNGVQYSSLASHLASHQEVNTLGGFVRQSFGYGKWVAFDAELSYGVPIGGVAGVGYTALIGAASARGSTFDVAGQAYASVPLGDNDRVLLEPMLGFGYLWLDIQDNSDGQQYGRMNNVMTVNAYGPMGGLFVRLLVLDNFSIRFGSAYQITKMQIDAYGLYGELLGKPAFRARRQGVLGRLRFDYKASDFVAFMLGFDVQSWAAGGSSVEPLSPYPPSAMTVRIARTRISWGVNFNY